jgi:hypothetical protein
MTAEHEGADVFDRDAHLLGEEVAKTRTVEHAGHADDHVVRQAAELSERPDHGVERIGDADDESLGTIVLDALAHLRHHLEVDAEQIVAAHARFARHARCDDDDVAVLDVGIGVGALELRVVTLDRTGLRNVERLSLRQPLHDVEENDVAQFLQADEMSERAADLSAADEGDFLAGHEKSFRGMPRAK